ncbi:MAG: trypsin-like peptidase domain-containing protein [Mobilitalea sp.]
MNEEYDSNNNLENSNNLNGNKDQGINPDNGTGVNNSTSAGQVPLIVDEIKPKRKRKFVGTFKLVAAAIAFGLIAGVAFQGYYMVTTPDTTETAKSNNLELQVADTSTSSDTIVPTSTDSDSVVTDVSDVVANVMPSIVAINSTVTETSYDIFGQEYSQEGEGSGSGIIVGQNGSEILIATNNHVITGATAVEIVFADETTAAGTVKGSDATADLAVVSVDVAELTKETLAAIKVATLGNSDEVKAGEMAIAIGNALGYGQSVTVGYISAVDREVTIDETTMTLLQTDAAINPGNSGGALINTSGQVIGINSVKYASEEVEGMGYAIPISDAVPMINELMNREVVDTSDQGFLGINTTTAQEVTEVYAARFNMPIGVYINDVVEGSPAEEAGLIQGDIITGIGSVKIETIEDMISALSYKKAGETIELVIQVRNNGAYEEKTIEVTLATK